VDSGRRPTLPQINIIQSVTFQTTNQSILSRDSECSRKDRYRQEYTDERNGLKLLKTSLWSKNSGKSETKLGSKVMAASLALSLLTAPLLSSIPHSYAATAAKAPTIKLVEEVPVTAGAKLQRYVWSSARSNVAVSTNANVLVIDLNNPNVNIDVMSGVDGQFTKRQTVKGMAQDTAAVAGVNGDYYGVTAEGAPIGPQITNGEFMSSPSYLSGMYAFALTKDKKPLIDSFTFTGTITAANGQPYALAGVNKTYYFTEPNGTHSHTNSLYIYTDAWGSTSRANDGYTTPTEVLVVNDIVTQISDKVALNMIAPADGYILRATGKAAEYVMQNMKVGDKLTASYQLVPSDATKTYDTANFRMMIGGHTILVNEGKATAYSRNVSSLGGYRSRTGVGYSKDGRFVYIITADKKDDSKGMSLSEFQGFMVSIGVWKGLNLDGGGSTQMVSRPLGDTDAVVVNKLENGTARQVVNGLGVYTLAPAGKLAGLFIQGEKTLFLHEKSTFALKAYDEYYNPITTGVQNAQWTAVNGTGSGTFESGVFTATGAGTATIAATADGIKQKSEIDIIGRRQINSMAFDSSDFVLSEGESYELPVIVATVKGVKRTIPSELLSWEFNGFEGTVTGNVVHVTKLGSTGIARIIARYDGFSTMLTQSAGVDKLFADFDATTYELQKQVTPDSVIGNVQLTPGLVVGEPNNNALTFEFNFTEGTGTKAIYASFGGTGIAVEGKPARMKIDVMGDATLNWLRAEIVDANNKTHMVDIANPIDWFGWKNINVDLKKYKMAYPIKLNRIYVVNPELGQDEREPNGYLAVDNITFQYEGELPVLPNAQVQMAIDRSSLTVNGNKQKLDQAPVLVKGTTMIPVRFFVDAMGGEVQWDAKNQRATIIRDHHLIEMWNKDEEVIVDGKRITSLEAPRLMKGRTMLPLRLIAEALGWKVGWDQTTKSITLE
jgi:exopolysaccharide biosynthesis protein